MHRVLRSAMQPALPLSKRKSPQPGLSAQVALSTGGVVIDVGANTGVFAINAAQCVGEKGLVLALEPAPLTAAVCEANVVSHAEWCKATTGMAPAPVETLQFACGDGSVDELKLVVYDKFCTLSSVMPDHDSCHTSVKVRAPVTSRPKDCMQAVVRVMCLA